MNVMQDFPIRWTTLSDAYAASLVWLIGADNSIMRMNSVPGIDLGNGTELSAIDIVDSHFTRLISSRPEKSDADSVDTINGLVSTDEPIKAEPNVNFSIASLRTAIDGLAPHLLSIVQVAENIADANPAVPPAKEFRLLLNAALLAEHKQQINKQTIGIQAPEADEDMRERIIDNKYALIAGLPLAATLFFSFWYLNRSRREHLHPESN